MAVYFSHHEEQEVTASFSLQDLRDIGYSLYPKEPRKGNHFRYAARYCACADLIKFDISTILQLFKTFCIYAVQHFAEFFSFDIVAC